MRTDIILRKLTTGIGERFEPSTTGVQLEGMVVRIDLETGLARSIEAIREPLPADWRQSHEACRSFQQVPTAAPCAR